MRKTLIFSTLTAALGGFLFGYDTAVISGTVPLVKEQFNLSALTEGWYVSSALVGSIAGVLLAGKLSEKFGRKKTLIMSAMLFFISAIGCMFSIGHTDLIIYRVLGGMGVGFASVVSPVYISEIAPANYRGRLVALYQFFLTIGILVAYIANSAIFEFGLNLDVENYPEKKIFCKIVIEQNWRMMLGTEIIPAFLFLMLLFFVPESPRWLIAKGNTLLARRTLFDLHKKDEAMKEIAEIKKSMKNKSAATKSLLKNGLMKALIIGVVLAALTQLSGINAIIYYGPSILQKTGIESSDALTGQVLIGIVNVLFTIIALWKIDSFGRKNLLIIGITGIIITLVILGVLFYYSPKSYILILTFIIIFIACFAFSYGPVIWVLLSEIYPTQMRGRAMAIATFSLWLGTAFVGQMVPYFLERIGSFGTFWLFAGLTLPAFFIVKYMLPETKGKSLEEIENFWKNNTQKSTVDVW